MNNAPQSTVLNQAAGIAPQPIATIAARATALDYPAYPDHLADAEWIKELAP